MRLSAAPFQLARRTSSPVPRAGASLPLGSAMARLTAVVERMKLLAPTSALKRSSSAARAGAFPRCAPATGLPTVPAVRTRRDVLAEQPTSSAGSVAVVLTRV